MGFGGGLLISILAFDLVEEAYALGGTATTLTGFLTGAVIFSTANWFLSTKGARHRKRCSECVVELGEHKKSGNELSIAIGSMMDSIPAAIIVGISLADSSIVSKSVLIGFFLANIPEGLAGSSGMKMSGRSVRYIMSVWGGATLLTGVAGMLGFSVFGSFPPTFNAFIVAISAGGILSMVAETMIPEAFKETRSFTGLITGLGFMVFYLLLKTSN